VTESFARAAIGAACDAGKPIVVDPKGANYKLYAGATVVTPNRAELALVTGRSVESASDLVAAARALFESVDLGAVLVTRSADGMTLVQRDGQVDHLSAESHEIADVTGAGDTVVATLGVAMGSGAGLLDSARLANAAAGIVVKRRGTAVVRIRELTAALLRRGLTAVEAKVADDITASARAALWRAEGLKIGFTNGCFDLLHPGHVSLLEQAKAASDKLIVGLNSDSSVRRLKGSDRPIQNELARATVLASMEAVDLVVVFDNDTPLSLIESLHPDVLVKGADYAKVDIVGSEQVEAYGGRVIRAELVDSVSTTATIASLKE
jgi:D-beta-D-heptose 7-phosphate kinase/D-beta-D-heptose 1-phosphate adenosyltransferase